MTRQANTKEDTHMPAQTPTPLVRTVTVTADGSAVVEVYKNEAGEIARTQSYTKAQLTAMLSGADARLVEAKARQSAALEAQNAQTKARLAEMIALLPA